MSDADTLPRLLDRNATRWPRLPAWRHKRLGIWQTQTWDDFSARSNDIAWGLAEGGFGRGDRLAVLGDNRPDLYAALIAAQALGGAGVPLDPEADPAALTAILEDAAVSVLIADTMDQARNVQQLVAALPSPPRVYCADTGRFHRHDAWEQMSLDALIAAGRAFAKREPSLLAAAIAHATPQDLALLLYPASGVTPGRRPLALSHAQLLTAAGTIAAADPVRHGDRTLCYLPMASYGDALYSLTLGLLGGFACNCPEAPDSVLRDLREIAPTILYASPAACAALAQVVVAKADAVTGLKRRSFAFFQRTALRAETLREQGLRVPVGLGLLCRIGELAAYAPVRDQLGLGRARWVHAGVPVPPDAERMLRALGVALRPMTGRVFEPDAAHDARETQHA